MNKVQLTIEQAKAQGYIVDTHRYPHIGYRGPRFNPTSHVEVFTETEAKLIAQCADLASMVQRVIFAARDGAILPRDSIHAEAMALLATVRA